MQFRILPPPPASFPPSSARPGPQRRHGEVVGGHVAPPPPPRLHQAPLGVPPLVSRLQHADRLAGPDRHLVGPRRREVVRRQHLEGRGGGLEPPSHTHTLMYVNTHCVDMR